jgi:hypothetical protein
MPYTIKLQDNVIRIALTGRVTPMDIASLVAETKKFETNVAVVPHRITDMTDVEELAIHYKNVSAVAEARTKLRFPNPFKSAFIAVNQHQLGYARMFQSLNGNPQITIQIFPDEASAVKWIGVAVKPPTIPSAIPAQKPASRPAP